MGLQICFDRSSVKLLFVNNIHLQLICMIILLFYYFYYFIYYTYDYFFEVLNVI